MGLFSSPGKVEELELSLAKMKDKLAELEVTMGKLPRSGELKMVYPDQKRTAEKFIDAAENAAKNCKRVFKL